MWRRPTARCCGSSTGKAASILQPVLISDGDLLVTVGDMMGGLGTRRLAVDARPQRMDGGGEVDVERAEAVLQRHRRAQRAMRTASTATSSRASISRTARASGRADATGTGNSCCWRIRTLLARALGGGRARAGQGDVRSGSPKFARSPAIEGKTWNHLVVRRRRAARAKRRRDGRVPAGGRAK